MNTFCVACPRAARGHGCAQAYARSIASSVRTPASKYDPMLARSTRACQTGNGVCAWNMILQNALAQPIITRQTKTNASQPQGSGGDCCRVLLIVQGKAILPALVSNQASLSSIIERDKDARDARHLDQQMNAKIRIQQTTNRGWRARDDMAYRIRGRIKPGLCNREQLHMVGSPP